MFVAIKDKKIIAYNKTGDFPCLVYDEVKEIDDVTLVHVNGEFLPDTDEKVIEQQNIEKSNQVKSIRNQYLSDTLSRCDRYEKQKAIGLDTTESEDTYRNYLLYLQYLRDVPQQLEFPNIEVLTFDNWSAKLNEKVNTSEES
nr:MAG TPA: hypothetical protein [Caudoviricetes sp.]